MRAAGLALFTAVTATLSAVASIRPAAGAEPLRCPDIGATLAAGHPLPAGTGGAAGLVASLRYPGWGWMVRQHKPPVLYAVRFPGGTGPHELRTIKIAGVTKVDWGDIVYQDGKLYAFESDQRWARSVGPPTRVIYEIPEPDPLRPPASVRPSAVYRYAYPGGRRYNTEAAFSFDGHLVLVPKTTPAQLYRFDGPLSRQRVNRPRFVASLRGSDTASFAAVSPDRTTLFLANHETLFAYRLPNPAAYLWHFATRPVQRRRINVGDNVEAGGFFLTGRCKLVLVAKSRNIYRLQSE